MSSFLIFFILLHSITAYAYLPARSTNSSQASLNGRSYTTDLPTLHLYSYSNGKTTHDISYQLASFQGNRIINGMLVHFSEAFVNESTPASYTPWIAMISCDANATDASMELDAFTLARHKGAKAAILYSLYSSTCVINPEFSGARTLDIFSVQGLANIRSITLQRRRAGPTIANLHDSYDSQRLNNSGADINSTVVAGYPVSPGYIYAVVRASNSTSSATSSTVVTAATSTPSNSNSANNSGSPSTALAMIVLYAITGCVSALFCVVIISGAIRAIRHPERYGPRVRFGDDGSPPQSRARGLTRAILDTFPVVKFGKVPETSATGKDVEAHVSENNGTELKILTRKPSERDSINDAKHFSEERTAGQMEGETQLGLEDDLGTMGILDPSPDNQIEQMQGGSYHLEQNANLVASTSANNRNELMPEAIGTETCPICILDFEEGDDIRILPCEGQHRFHQNCVDPWLLELSSSCPICRHDFHALETMLSNDLEDDDAHDHRHSRRASQVLANRFSRYLRFARRRRSRLQREMEQQDTATEPHARISPEAIARES